MPTRLQLGAEDAPSYARNCVDKTSANSLGLLGFPKNGLAGNGFSRRSNHLAEAPDPYFHAGFQEPPIRWEELQLQALVWSG